VNIGLAVEARPDEVVGADIGLRDPARDLPRMLVRIAEEAEHRQVVDIPTRTDAVAGLLQKLA
jgi:hypothetical protein